MAAVLPNATPALCAVLRVLLAERAGLPVRVIAQRAGLSPADVSVSLAQLAAGKLGYEDRGRRRPWLGGVIPTWHLTGKGRTIGPQIAAHHPEAPDTERAR